MLIIDQMAYSSKLRYMSPSLKAFFSITMLLIVIGIQSISLGILTTALVGGITIRAGGVPLIKYCKLLRIPFVFLIMSVVAIVFSVTNQQVGEWCIQLGDIYISTNLLSLEQGIRLFVTALAAVSCMYFLSLTTPMTDIFHVMKKIHCPFILIELMLLIYRFIFILLEISQSLSISQQSRLGNRNFRSSMKSTTSLMSVLFLRAFKKSSTLYDAMESRCYDGEIHVLYEYKKANRKEIIIMTTVLLITFVAAILLK